MEVFVTLSLNYSKMYSFYDEITFDNFYKTSIYLVVLTLKYNVCSHLTIYVFFKVFKV